jgi:hypothetical protein
MEPVINPNGQLEQYEQGRNSAFLVKRTNCHFLIQTTIHKDLQCHETGITTVQSPSQIIGPKGIKHIGAMTNWEREKNVTVCCSFTAAGHYIPPMFVSPQTNVTKS